MLQNFAIKTTNSDQNLEEEAGTEDAASIVG